MTFLNRIEAAGEPSRDAEEGGTARGGERRIRLTLDVGRNLVVGIVLVGLLVGIVVLYSSDEDAAARILVDLFIAVLSGGLGLNAGERAGAEAAERALRDANLQGS